MKDEPPSYPSHQLDLALPAEVRVITPEHSALVATRDLHQGEVVCHFCLSGLSDTPSRYSIQLREDQHGLLVPIELSYMNHACDPSVVVQVDQLRIVALRDIRAGEEITFFYPSLEWRMAEPFPCACDSIHCLRWVEGAHSLPDEVLARHTLSPAIQAQVAQRAPLRTRARL